MSARYVTRTDKRTGKVSSYWFVDVTVKLPTGEPKTKRKVSPIQTKRGAEQFERELRQSLLDGTYVEKEEVEKKKTFAEFAKEFVETYSVAHNKPSAVTAKRLVVKKHLNPVFGAMTLDQIDLRKIDAYKSAKLKDKLAAKTVNTHLAVLGKLLRVAVEWGELTHAPRIKLLREVKPKFDFLTFEEADLLLTGFDDPFWRTMVLVAMRTGMRPGELRALPWSEVDLKAGRLTVRYSEVNGVLGTPKDHEVRDLRLPLDALEALKTLARRPSGRVFVHPDGQKLTPSKCRKPLWRACKKAGLREITWYCLRHTFASHLVMKGVPLKGVQELMGHAGVEMTLRYAHLSPESKDEWVMRLGPQKPAP